MPPCARASSRESPRLRVPDPSTRRRRRRPFRRTLRGSSRPMPRRAGPRPRRGAWPRSPAPRRRPPRARVPRRRGGGRRRAPPSPSAPARRATGTPARRPLRSHFRPFLLLLTGPNLLDPLAHEVADLRRIDDLRVGSVIEDVADEPAGIGDDVLDEEAAVGL